MHHDVAVLTLVNLQMSPGQNWKCWNLRYLCTEWRSCRWWTRFQLQMDHDRKTSTALAQASHKKTSRTFIRVIKHSSIRWRINWFLIFIAYLSSTELKARHLSVHNREKWAGLWKVTSPKSLIELLWLSKDLNMGLASSSPACSGPCGHEESDTTKRLNKKSSSQTF